MRPSAHMDKNPSQPDRPGRTGTAARRRRGIARFSLLLLVPLLAGTLGGPVSPVGADELSDARARQNALAAQLKKQKAEVAKINALQAEVGQEIASTKRALNGINADLVAVRKSINSMVVKIEVVRQEYLGLVAKLELLDTQLGRLRVTEQRMRWRLEERKELLAERLRQAYDTDRTSLLETFLSGGSFTDVLSEVSYSIDVGEQDKALAQQIIGD